MSQVMPPRPGRRLSIPGIALLLCSGLLIPGDSVADQVDSGRKLFNHVWVPNDPLSPAGDGLGPMHNADSCVACHSLGADGGAGPASRNVALLSVLPATNEPDAATTSLAPMNAAKLHPAFRTSANLVLHHFDTNAGYDRWKLFLLGFKPPPEKGRRSATTRRAIERKLASLPPVAEVRRAQNVSLHLSQRNTTALFGAGQIDSISEKTLTELARQQPLQFPGIQGRLPRTAEGKIGRFGWRGQVATLKDFVLTACAMELGLQNDGHPQAIDPLDPKSQLKGNDLTGEQCDALVAFVASLPAPRRIEPVDQHQANLMAHGEKLFETVGCAACHVRDVGAVQGIFSDLLLHDLGAGLEDPVPAVPERTRVGTVRTAGGYSGGGSFDVFADLPSPIRREWRTPPLWGVRDSAPYLHDGRAQTLEQAIAAHGGEAAPSAQRYAALDDSSQSHVLLFLNSLAAPK